MDLGATAVGLDVLCLPITSVLVVQMHVPYSVGFVCGILGLLYTTNWQLAIE